MIKKNKIKLTNYTITNYIKKTSFFSYQFYFICTGGQFHLGAKRFYNRIAIWRIILFYPGSDFQLILALRLLFSLAFHIRSLLVLFFALFDWLKVLWMACCQTLWTWFTSNCRLVCLQFWTRCKMILFVPNLIICFFPYWNKMACYFLVITRILGTCYQSNRSIWLFKGNFLFQL